MKRRYFLGITAATVAMAAVPALSDDAIGANHQPEIGTTFYSQVWVGEEGLQEAAFEQGDAAMRYVEKDREVRLGNYVYHHKFDKERDAWSVTTQASVVGYV